MEVLRAVNPYPGASSPSWIISTIKRDLIGNYVRRSVSPMRDGSTASWILLTPKSLSSILSEGHPDLPHLDRRSCLLHYRCPKITWTMSWKMGNMFCCFPQQVIMDGTDYIIMDSVNSDRVASVSWMSYWTGDANSEEIFVERLLYGLLVRRLWLVGMYVLSFVWNIGRQNILH